MISVIRITTSSLLLSGLVVTWLMGVNIVTLLSIITILMITMLMVETCIQSCCMPYSWSTERRQLPPKSPHRGGEDPQVMKNAA